MHRKTIDLRDKLAKKYQYLEKYLMDKDKIYEGGELERPSVNKRGVDRSSSEKFVIQSNFEEEKFQ